MELSEAFEQLKEYVNNRMHEAPTAEAREEASLMRNKLNALFQERVAGSYKEE